MAEKKNGIAQKASELCTPTIEELGYEVVEVRYGKEGAEYVLCFFVDRRGGIGLDDCEKISLAIDPLLDEHLQMSQPYLLTVSSPGLDRPLKTERDFLRHLGDELEVSLYKQYKGEQKPCGILRAYENGTLVLELEDGELLELQPSEYSKVSQAIRF